MKIGEQIDFRLRKHLAENRAREKEMETEKRSDEIN